MEYIPNIIDKLKTKEPKFPKKYKYLFEKYARKWGGSEEERLDKAKVFRNNYELYVYAFFLGVRKKQRLPFENRSEELSKENVSSVGAWKPIVIRDYLIACVLAEDGTPFREYDLMEDRELDRKSSYLREIIEEYVHGGLKLLDDQFNEDKGYFSELFAFTKFVFE